MGVDKLVRTVAAIVSQNQQLSNHVANKGIKRGVVSGTNVNVEGIVWSPIWSVDDLFSDGDNVCVMISDDGKRAVVIGKW